ncbi:MAG: hypothetical protein O2894_00995 [Planctomycetota bacterium]|nr:hypothetical protein [Planctomycetota bacterium]
MRKVLLILAAFLLVATTAARADDENDAEAKAAMARKKADIIFQARVRRAIGAGAHWIAERQKHDGSFELSDNPRDGPFPESRHGFGVSVLCLYTLADCGYDADHPVVKKALAHVRKRYRSLLKGDHWPQASAYTLALLVLGLHTLFVTPEARDAAVERDRYGKDKRDAKNPCGYPTWVRAAIKEILDWFMENQAETGLFRYPAGFNMGTRPPAMPGGPPASHFGDEDLSNTQYVLLALWAGSRCGYVVSREQLERIAGRLLEYQERTGPAVPRRPDPAAPQPGAEGARYAPPTPPGTGEGAPRDAARGFPYTLDAPVTGSMTTAGLSSLAIVKAMLLERDELSRDWRDKIDRGLWDAIAWLDTNFSVHANPGAGSMWHYYYLYGLERAGVIAGKRYLGDHDWYREGAELLLDAQTESGAWEPPDQLGGFGAGMPGGSPYRTSLLDTCFALLFLKRATIKPDRPILENPRPVTTKGG